MRGCPCQRFNDRAAVYYSAELRLMPKWDAGFGIRAWVQGIVARIDTAYSDADFGVRMMINQPFQL